MFCCFFLLAPIKHVPSPPSSWHTLAQRSVSVRCPKLRLRSPNLEVDVPRRTEKQRMRKSNAIAPQTFHSAKTCTLLIEKDAAVFIFQMNPGSSEVRSQLLLVPELAATQPVYFYTPFMLITECIRITHQRAVAVPALRRARPCTSLHTQLLFSCKMKTFRDKGGRTLKGFLRARLRSQ